MSGTMEAEKKPRKSFRMIKICLLISVGYGLCWLQGRCGVSNGILACDLWSVAI